MADYCIQRLQSFHKFFPSDLNQRRIEFYTELRRQKRENIILKNRGFTMDLSKFSKIEKSPEIQTQIIKTEKYKSFISSKPLKGDPKKFEKIFEFLESHLNILSDRQLIINCLLILIELTLITELEETLNKYNFVSLCLDLLDFDSKLVSESSIWCLSNLSIGNPKARNEIIENINFTKIILFSTKYINDSLGKVSIWCVTNLIRLRPMIFSPKLPILLELFINLTPLLNDQESLIEVLWALERLTSNISATLATLIERRFLFKICRLISNLNHDISLPCLKIVNNLITQRLKIREIVACHVLDLVLKAMSTVNYKLVKESICIVNQLTILEAYSVTEIVNHKIVKKTMEIVTYLGEGVKVEAADFLSNLIHLSNNQSLIELIDKKIIFVLCGLLESVSNQVRYLALQGLYETLKLLCKFLQEDQKNLYIEQIENCSGLSQIEKLVYSNEPHISDLASELIELYKD